MNPIFAIALFSVFASTIQAGERPWTPDLDYHVDRRLSAGDPITSAWSYSAEAERAEYRMLYLLQAHKEAVQLTQSLQRKGGEGPLTREQLLKLRQVRGNLGEVVMTSFAEVTPYFATHPNPTLLLMMLFHFEVYCNGGDSNEGWPSVIKPLQALDPGVTAKALAAAHAWTD